MSKMQMYLADYFYTTRIAPLTLNSNFLHPADNTQGDIQDESGILQEKEKRLLLNK